MYRLYSVFFLFAVLVSMAVPAVASDIAVVDYARVLKESSAAKSASDQLDARKKQYQSQISTEETALQKEEQELAKQQSILAQDAFKERVKQFREKAAKTQMEVRQKRIVLRKAGDAALGEILRKVTTIIGQMAKEKGFKVAAPAATLLYADPSLDITSELISRLNKEMPSVTVKFE